MLPQVLRRHPGAQHMRGQAFGESCATRHGRGVVWRVPRVQVWSGCHAHTIGALWLGAAKSGSAVHSHEREAGLSRPMHAGRHPAAREAGPSRLGCAWHGPAVHRG
eukprot:356135-Chlamydomonas_euryale.AAC.2